MKNNINYQRIASRGALAVLAVIAAAMFVPMKAEAASRNSSFTISIGVGSKNGVHISSGVFARSIAHREYLRGIEAGSIHGFDAGYVDGVRNKKFAVKIPRSSGRMSNDFYRGFVEGYGNGYSKGFEKGKFDLWTSKNKKKSHAKSKSRSHSNQRYPHRSRRW